MSGYVYMIREANSTYYKIGSAVDPLKRLATLQAGSPKKLELVCQTHSEAFRQLEAFLRAKWKDYRVHREWFSFGYDTLSNVWLDFNALGEAKVLTKNFDQKQKTHQDPFIDFVRGTVLKMNYHIELISRKKKALFEELRQDPQYNQYFAILDLLHEPGMSESDEDWLFGELESLLLTDKDPKTSATYGAFEKEENAYRDTVMILQCLTSGDPQVRIRAKSSIREDERFCGQLRRNGYTEQDVVIKWF